MGAGSQWGGVKKKWRVAGVSHGHDWGEKTQVGKGAPNRMPRKKGEAGKKKKKKNWRTNHILAKAKREKKHRRSDGSDPTQAGRSEVRPLSGKTGVGVDFPRTGTNKCGPHGSGGSGTKHIRERGIRLSGEGA